MDVLFIWEKELVMISGNAYQAGKDRRGWFVGQFLADDSPLKTDDVEIKWGVIKAGTTKAGAGVNNVAKTLTILIDGDFVMRVHSTDIPMRKQGDYVFTEPGEPHTWRAIANSTVLTVRWPSMKNDQKTTAIG